MKYLLVVLLATAVYAVEDEIIDTEVSSDVQSAQFMYQMSPMGMGMGMAKPFMTPMMNRKSYSSSCVQACPCVQRCMMVWWVPCPCWCPPPCDSPDETDPPTPPPTEPPTPPPTQPPTIPPEDPPSDCDKCSCVWVPCQIWWMCRPRCQPSCCQPKPPSCCTPCQPCTSWPCQPCNPCNNPCPEPEVKEIEPETEKPILLPDLDEWRERLREGLNVILGPKKPEEPEPEVWWDDLEEIPRPRPQPPRPPVRRP